MDLDREEAIDRSLTTTGSPSSKLIVEGNELSSKIVNTNSSTELEDLTQLFNMNQKKKEMVRVNKLNSLLELIDDEIFTRFTSYPDSFDHDQLLNYMRATTNAINNSTQSINQAPIIQINNNTTEVNVSGSGLDRDSRARVMDAVNDILNSLQVKQSNDIIDIDVEETDSEEGRI